MTKDEIKEYVEVCRIDPPNFLHDSNEVYQVQMLLGYKITGIEFFWLEKLRNSFCMSFESWYGDMKEHDKLYLLWVEKFLDAAVSKWDSIQKSELREISVSLFADHFMQKTVFDDSITAGDWPIISTFQIKYDDVFLLKLVGDTYNLPEQFAHLKALIYPNQKSCAMRRLQNGLR